MTFKIKRNINIRKKLQAAQSKSSREIKKKIVKTVLNEYNRGVSPVKGFNKYKPYRPSTAKKKGRKSPVTIKESGKLHASLVAIQKTKSSFSLLFKGARNQKIAQFIHFGTDNMDARPLIPTRGQVFKKRITDKFNKIVETTLKKFLK